MPHTSDAETVRPTQLFFLSFFFLSGFSARPDPGPLLGRCTHLAEREYERDINPASERTSLILSSYAELRAGVDDYGLRTV